MKVGERGQVTIPKKLRIRYGLDEHTEVEFVDEGDGIRIVKSERGVDRFAKVRGSIKLEPGQTVDDYIEEIRGR
jgi:AbrB family looped-hinge helix DNA binding protein